jgi:hypothetical protein
MSLFNIESVIEIVPFYVISKSGKFFMIFEQMNQLTFEMKLGGLPPDDLHVALVALFLRVPGHGLLQKLGSLKIQFN